MRLSIIFFGFLIIGQDIIAIEKKNLILNEKTFFLDQWEWGCQSPMN